MDLTEKFIIDHQVEINKFIKEYLPKFRGILETEGIQKTVDIAYNLMDSINEDTGLNDRTTCAGAGCNFCCYGEISLSSLEASYIHSYINQVEIPFDKKLVERQNLKPHKDLAYANKRCAMLNAEGKCRIYEIRPSICRLHNSTSEPQQCDERKGPPSIQTLRTIETFGIAGILYLLSDEKVYKLQNILFEYNM